MATQEVIKKRKSFSDFDLLSALKHVGIREPLFWDLKAAPKEPSDFFREKLDRLDAFDTARSEGAKLLIVDAFFEEAVQPYKRKIRIFKEVTIRGENSGGLVDYVITQRGMVPDTPYLCVSEAKKDDFDKGMAQCLVEMKTISELNIKEGKKINIYGVVTNGSQWQFNWLDINNNFYASEDYVASDAPRLLGILDLIFAACAANLD
jgi:hypothetical protein